MKIACIKTFVIDCFRTNWVFSLMYPSDRPGLGVELDEKAAAAHPKADH